MESVSDVSTYLDGQLKAIEAGRRFTGIILLIKFRGWLIRKKRYMELGAIKETIILQNGLCLMEALKYFVNFTFK